MKEFQTASIEQYDKLLDELNALHNVIHKTKQEIAYLRTEEGSQSCIPNAQLELDAVVEATAQATDNILSCTEEIMDLSAKVEKELGQELIQRCTRIFEACTFQDLTGQRITKVVKTLQIIEEQLARILHGFTPTADQSAYNSQKDSKIIKNIDFENLDETKLMNGPQLKTPQQKEIDHLFKELK